MCHTTELIKLELDEFWFVRSSCISLTITGMILTFITNAYQRRVDDDDDDDYDDDDDGETKAGSF